jgi:hypothetical protein
MQGALEWGKILQVLERNFRSEIAKIGEAEMRRGALSLVAVAVGCVGFATPSMSASDLASQLRGQKFCDSNGNIGVFKADGSFVAYPKGETQVVGRWEANGGDTVKITYLSGDYRIDRMTVAPGRRVRDVGVGGDRRHKGGSYPVGIEVDGYLCD